MKKLCIIFVHLLFSSLGALKWCFSKGMRRFTYEPGSSYTARFPYDHPAAQDIVIVLQKLPQEPRCLSFMLCNSITRDVPQYITWTIPLN